MYVSHFDSTNRYLMYSYRLLCHTLKSCTMPRTPLLLNLVEGKLFDSVPNPRNDAGPFARIPLPGPDHIDDLHKDHSSNTIPPTPGDNPPFLPPLSFESEPPTSTVNGTPSPVPKKHALFNHPAMNNSEPALSTMLPTPPTLTHRSATMPGKQFAFAANLSIYDDQVKKTPVLNDLRDETFFSLPRNAYASSPPTTTSSAASPCPFPLPSPRITPIDAKRHSAVSRKDGTTMNGETIIHSCFSSDNSHYLKDHW